MKFHMQRYCETRTMSQISESSKASDHQPLVTESGSRILDHILRPGQDLDCQKCSAISFNVLFLALLHPNFGWKCKWTSAAFTLIFKFEKKKKNLKVLQNLSIILLDLLFSRKDSDAAGVDLTPRLNVSLLPLSLNMSPVPRHLWLTGQGARNNLCYFFASQTRIFSLILRKGRSTLLAAVLWFRDTWTLISHWYCLTTSSFITQKENNLTSTYFLVSSFVLMSLSENQDNFLWTENALTALVTFAGSKNSSALGWASAQFNPSICSAH